MSAVSDFYDEFKPKLVELRANQESQKVLIQQVATSQGRIMDDVKRVLVKLETAVGDPADPGKLAELREGLNAIMADAQAGSAAVQTLQQTASAIDDLVPEDAVPPVEEQPPVEEPPPTEELPPVEEQRSRTRASHDKHAHGPSSKGIKK